MVRKKKKRRLDLSMFVCPFQVRVILGPQEGSTAGSSVTLSLFVSQSFLVHWDPMWSPAYPQAPWYKPDDPGLLFCSGFLCFSHMKPFVSRFLTHPAINQAAEDLSPWLKEFMNPRQTCSLRGQSGTRGKTC